MYGMYPNAEQWRVNATFIIVLGLMAAGYFFPLKYKKYLNFLLCYFITNNFISFNLLFNFRWRIWIRVG